MLYKIAHFLRDKLTFLWDIIELMNSCLFSMKYGKRIESFMFSTKPAGFIISRINDIPVEKMVEFFKQQPEDAFTYFRPHGFDNKSIVKLQNNRSFLGYVLIEQSTNSIAGYCFIRCFFIGKGFRGRMVDINYRGKGLGTSMNKILNEVGFGIGLRLFETVSKDNVASYRSALSASRVKVLKEMPHNELYLEVLPE